MSARDFAAWINFRPRCVPDRMAGIRLQNAGQGSAWRGVPIRGSSSHQLPACCHETAATTETPENSCEAPGLSDGK